MIYSQAVFKSNQKSSYIDEVKLSQQRFVLKAHSWV